MIGEVYKHTPVTIQTPMMGEAYKHIPVTIEEPWGNGKRLSSGVHDNFAYKVSNDVHLCNFGFHLDKSNGHIVIECFGGTSDHDDHVYLKFFLLDKEGHALCHVPAMVINPDGSWGAVPFGPLEIPGGYPHNAHAFVCEGHFPVTLYPLIEGAAVWGYE